MTPKIAVAGSLAQRAGRAGHAWVFLQYLLGFRRLGFDVLFVDEMTNEPAPGDAGVAWLSSVMQQSGLAHQWTVLTPSGSVGRDREDVLSHLSESVFVLNVMGFLSDSRPREAARRLVFLDIDPGFPQMWKALGLADVFADHDDFVTVGANVGSPESIVPTCALPWITIHPPVVLDAWPDSPPPSADAAITSICTWRGPFGPIDFEGRTFGLRVHEFRRFVELPARTGAAFELALDIDPGDEADRVNLAAHGFRLVDPLAVAGSLEHYRTYVQSSRAELCIAKNLYVQSRGGWFSDRSACYLASGRPVICQDTGLADSLPSGQGLLLVTTPDEAVDAITALDADPALHTREARRIAEQYLDSDIVLRGLLDRLGVAP